MRTKILASLLILCGSTAAVASVTAMPQDTDAMTNNSVLENKVEEPAPAPETTPPAPAPDTTTTDATTTDDAEPAKPGEATPPQ